MRRKPQSRREWGVIAAEAATQAGMAPDTGPFRYSHGCLGTKISYIESYNPMDEDTKGGSSAAIGTHVHPCSPSRPPSQKFRGRWQ